MASHSVREIDVEYRRDADGPWLARVYQPEGAGPFPTLLDVHGGAWCQGTRESDALMNRALAEGGILVVAIDFRLGPIHPYPASMVDLNCATRWLKAHAADFGGDPTRIGALGSSSGGHMALLSAMRPRDPRYAALPLDEAPEADASLDYVIACWPVVDPYDRYLYAREAGRSDLVERSEGYFRTVEAMREASPRLILDGAEEVPLPPVLVIHGTEDANVPMRLVDDFAAAYGRAGGAIELAVFPGAPHGFGNRPGPDTDRALELMRQFVAQHAGAPVAAS